jgi:hypothetical protein
MAITSVMLGGVIAAQDAASQLPVKPSATLNAPDMHVVVEAALRELARRYVFEDVAQKVSVMLAEKRTGKASALNPT